MVWEATLGIYLVTKGFAPPARRRDTRSRAIAPAAAVLV
jgi:hypothetical protein